MSMWMFIALAHVLCDLFSFDLAIKKIFLISLQICAKLWQWGGGGGATSMTCQGSERHRQNISGLEK